jgi:hypothetical protein
LLGLNVRFEDDSASSTPDARVRVGAGKDSTILLETLYFLSGASFHCPAVRRRRWPYELDIHSIRIALEGRGMYS